MICVLDANALVLWASASTDERTLLRLDHLLDTMSKSGGRIVLPTPALSELLVRANEGTSAWLAALQRRSTVSVASFDLRAAAECAFIHRLATKAGGKRAGTKSGEHYQKIKVDRQIAAIAKVSNADLIVTDDENLIAVSKFIGLATSKVAELELPASAAQMKMELLPPEIQVR
jgi:predicted nucleic acid-binding protein